MPLLNIGTRTCMLASVLSIRMHLRACRGQYKNDLTSCVDSKVWFSFPLYSIFAKSDENRKAFHPKFVRFRLVPYQLSTAGP